MGHPCPRKPANAKACNTQTQRVARAIGLVLLARVPLPLRQHCVSIGFPICESLRTWVCETKTAVSGGTRWSEGQAAGLLPKAHECWGGEPSMTGEAGTSAPELTKRGRRLAILLAMAMFVLVVDTSVMNVTIASVVHDLHTTVSGVQSAIALEALVSAAFILIGSKVGDLIGRKRAYVLGLLGYGIGAIAMAVAQGLTTIIIFWAIVGGIGASLLLPAMQSLIHGNFEGAAQRQAYALVGAAAAIAAAVGPLIGGFITTYLSWRIAFLLEDVIIVVVLSGIRLVNDVEYTGSRRVDVVGAVLSVVGMGGIVLGILVWQEGGEAVGLLLALGAVSLGALA